MGEPFTADVVDTKGNGAVVRFVGELDLGQVSAAETAADYALEQCSGGPLIIDLAELVFCDSAGVGALLTIEQAANAQDCELILRAPVPKVRRVFEVVGLDEHLTIEN